MEQGRVLAEQDISAFFDAPASKEVREYIDFERI
jgi:hypothetical protein